MTDTSQKVGQKCAECGDEYARRHLQTVPVMVDLPDGGYEDVPMPVCDHCRGRMYGYDCPHCGINYSEKEEARYCCERAPGEAPDCPGCNRRMERLSWGHHADGRPTCEFAECEDCGIQWGKYTGWHDPEDNT